MKIRIGVAAGTQAASDLEGFGPLVDDLERLGFDSIWLPEVFTVGTLDPLTGLGFVAGRTKKLKIGTHLVAPGRNPVRLAKSLATLDRLSEGRLLLTFVLGLADPAELAAQQVTKEGRVDRLEEMLTLVRLLWSEDHVSFAGEYVSYDGPGVQPRPAQEPLEVWMGGMLPSSLRRVGRLADGWIPGLCTPDQAAEAKVIIDAAAAEAGREVDEEHFGVNVTYSTAPLSAEARAGIERRNPKRSPDELVPDSLAGLRKRLEEFVDVGFSKFVIRPLETPADWTTELEAAADAVLDMHDL